MSGVIDTNLLLYAANADAEEHAAARRFLEDAGKSSGTWYVTESILYEFLRVATHPRVFPHPLTKKQAMSFAEAIWTAAPFAILSPGPRHWELLRTEVKAVANPAGNLFFDIRTVVLMREHGVRTIYTADTDFLQFDGIEIVNPLEPATG